MASQIAEQEDHVVVEDVRGEAKTGLEAVQPWEEVQLELQSQTGRGIQAWEPALSHCRESF